MRALVYHEILRRSFTAFLGKVLETVAPAEPFQPNWHHHAIAWQIERIERGEINRLVVTIPPRHLKSIMLSVAWVAFALGHDPRRRFVCVSYSSKLSLTHARQCRAVMQSSWYRELFPNTLLRGRAAEADFDTTAGGGRFSTSVGGTITGRGGQTIIIDDPIKPTEAHSDLIRQGVNDWYRETLPSRVDNLETGVFVLIMQRVHEDDLAGHVLGESDWHHLDLPAIAIMDEEIPIGDGLAYCRSAGVPLHPARQSLSALGKQKRRMGEAEFSAQYQQRPIPAGGLMVKRDELRTYDSVPARQTGDRIVQSWDTATRDGLFNDFSACVTALVRGRQIFILDVYREKLRFGDLLVKVRAHAQHWRADVLLIEDAASGAQLLDVLGKEPWARVPSPIACKPDADKKTRMSGQTDRFQAGEVYLPADADWLAMFLHELLGFPKTKFDDQVDALVHLLAWSRPWFDPTPQNVGPELITLDDDNPWDPAPREDYDDGWGPS